MISGSLCRHLKIAECFLIEVSSPYQPGSLNVATHSLQSLLPAGTNVQTAAEGFKNQGQFVAGVHVSHNLNIPFDELKARVTGPKAESLGKAIEQLRPDLDKKTVRDGVKDTPPPSRRRYPGVTRRTLLLASAAQIVILSPQIRRALRAGPLD
jgi:hypothetical protein